MSGFVWDWHVVWSILPDLMEGIKFTLVATFFGSLLAFALGMVWTLVRLARIAVATPAVSYFIQFVRGTPLLVQLYFLFFVFPNWGILLPPLTTGILGLGVFYSAYAAEIYRAGIEDLAPGQWEAALVLGLPIRRVWLGIVLAYDSFYWPPRGHGWPVSFFVVALVLVFYLLAQARPVGRGGKPGRG